ncbi:MAG: outer membrane beta-barrel protein [Acidobacteriaceae bacterium]
MEKLWAACLLALMGLGGAGARAQMGLYAMGSGGFLGSVNASSGSLVVSQNSLSAFGGTFGFYDTLARLGPLHIGGDARYVIESSDGSTPYGNQIRSGLIGPRLALRSHAAPFSPYLQFEIGGASTNYGHYASRSTSFAYQVQFGLDWAVAPHIDTRIEYGGGKIGSAFNGYNQEMQQIGIGLVGRW